MSMPNAVKQIKEIRRRTRRTVSAEEKTRIVMEGLQGECSIAELCRREGYLFQWALLDAQFTPLVENGRRGLGITTCPYQPLTWRSSTRN